MLFPVLSLLASTMLSTEAVRGLKGACKSKNFTMVPIDVERYMGAWYEIAHSKSFPWNFDCRCTTAEYSLKNDGTLRVVNTCRRADQKSGIFQREATAKQVEPGHLSVNFFKGIPVANADYRVIYVDDEYNHAVVVSCSLLGGSLTWILSRHPHICDKKYEELKAIPMAMGFDLSDLERTVQEDCWSFKKQSDAIVRRELKEYSGAVPDRCASLATGVSSLPVNQLEARWHILYTQPDFVENLFSKNCLCNTVTLQKSETIGYEKGGTFRSTVACRAKTPTGPRFDFVRPVFEISNLTSYLGHFTQKLYQGLADEHWQILAYGQGDELNHDPSTPFKSDNLEHMLLYTCLDAKVGKTFCLHIVSKENKISKEAVEKYYKYAESLGVLKKDIMRPVFHGDQCIYDPKPSQLILQ